MSDTVNEISNENRGFAIKIQDQESTRNKNKTNVTVRYYIYTQVPIFTSTDLLNIFKWNTLKRVVFYLVKRRTKLEWEYQ